MPIGRPAGGSNGRTSRVRVSWRRMGRTGRHVTRRTPGTVPYVSGQSPSSGVVLLDRRQLPEEPVRLLVRTRGEQQRLPRADHPVAELERPEPVDPEPVPALVAQLAEETPADRV